jgi:hypothetical protein
MAKFKICSPGMPPSDEHGQNPPPAWRLPRR